MDADRGAGPAVGRAPVLGVEPDPAGPVRVGPEPGRGAGAGSAPAAPAAYLVEPRASPAHRAVPVNGGARPWVALVVALGVGLAAFAIAAAAHGPPGAVPVAAPPVSTAPTPSAPAVAVDPAAPSTDPAAQPAALRATEVFLPTLDVRSTLVGLDVGAGGGLQAPADPAVAGWYVRGAAPGEPGPTVIAGHVDSRSGPAVFYRLDELRPGDRVEVTRSDGRVFGYRVVTVEQHPKTAFPTNRVYGPTPSPELRLITCGGDFDTRSRHYRDNVVVMAVPAA